MSPVHGQDEEEDPQWAIAMLMPKKRPADPKNPFPSFDGRRAMQYAESQVNKASPYQDDLPYTGSRHRPVFADPTDIPHPPKRRAMHIKGTDKP